MDVKDLPKAKCQRGYPAEQLKEIFPEQSELNAFDYWMRGQTVGMCNGRTYDPVTEREEPSGCGPHGVVVYQDDLERYLRGQPVID